VELLQDGHCHPLDGYVSGLLRNGIVVPLYTYFDVTLFLVQSVPLSHHNEGSRKTGGFSWMIYTLPTSDRYWLLNVLKHSSALMLLYRPLFVSSVELNA
jgi:hypothetical protein